MLVYMYLLYIFLNKPFQRDVLHIQKQKSDLEEEVAALQVTESTLLHFGRIPRFKAIQSRSVLYKDKRLYIITCTYMYCHLLISISYLLIFQDLSCKQPEDALNTKVSYTCRTKPE